MGFGKYAAAAIAAAFATAAMAQGSARSDLEPPRVAPEAVRTLHAFARCVALESPARARAVLAADEGSAGFVNAIQRLADNNHHCLNRGSLSANERFFAGRMAEALLLTDLQGQDLARRVALDETRPPVRANGETALMGICIVRAAPAEVAALFATDPASAEEAAAMRAVTPHLGRCLRTGVEAHFNRPAIRSILALAAFRLSENNQPAR